MSVEVDIVLASASPRRAALLQQVGVRFEVVIPEVDEQARSGESPRSLVSRLADIKAKAGERVLEQRSRAFAVPVLGADTLVVLEDEIMGKPQDDAQAIEMLSRLSGNVHRVLTAVTVRLGAQIERALSETFVTFRNLSIDEQHKYVSSGEPMDKAGAYAIQGRGACFVSRIDGSYSGVVGLPLMETSMILSTFGIHCLGPLR